MAWDVISVWGNRSAVRCMREYIPNFSTNGKRSQVGSRLTIWLTQTSTDISFFFLGGGEIESEFRAITIYSTFTDGCTWGKHTQAYAQLCCERFPLKSAEPTTIRWERQRCPGGMRKLLRLKSIDSVYSSEISFMNKVDWIWFADRGWPFDVRRSLFRLLEPFRL